MKSFILKYPKISFHLFLFGFTLASTALDLLVYHHSMIFFYFYPLIMWQVGWVFAHTIYFEAIRRYKASYKEHLIVLCIAIIPMFVWFIFLAL